MRLWAQSQRCCGGSMREKSMPARYQTRPASNALKDRWASIKVQIIRQMRNGSPRRRTCRLVWAIAFTRNRIPERRLVLPDATWRPSMPIRPWMCWIFLNGELKWLCETVRRCLMSEQSHQVICLKSRRLAARLISNNPAFIKSRSTTMAMQ